jgi:hypothetical protein
MQKRKTRILKQPPSLDKTRTSITMWNPFLRDLRWPRRPSPPLYAPPPLWRLAASSPNPSALSHGTTHPSPGSRRSPPPSAMANDSRSATSLSGRRLLPPFRAQGSRGRPPPPSSPLVTEGPHVYLLHLRRWHLAGQPLLPTPPSKWIASATARLNYCC